MAIPTIPTAAEIKARIIADIETEINQTVPTLSKSFVRVLSGALAGMFLLIYQATLWVYRQIFPDTADDVTIALLGDLVNVLRLPAEFALLQADATGVETYTIQTGVLFQGSNSIVYKVTTGGTIAGGVASIELTAQTAGEIGNLPNGSILNIIQPDSNLSGTAEVTATIESGDDQETLDAYRSRVSGEYKKRRTGGAPADYESWGLETPNFDWISPLDDPDTAGEVIVYGRVDNQTDGIPTGNQLAELDDFLNNDPNTGLRTRHPIGPPTDPQAISRFLFDIEIFIQNTTPAIEASVTTAVTAYLENQEPFNEAIRTVRKDTISAGQIAAVANGVANPEGATIADVELSQVTPALQILSYQLFGGEFGKVDTITYTVVL